MEVVKEQDNHALLASTGQIRFGEVNWADDQPAAQFIKTREAKNDWNRKLLLRFTPPFSRWYGWGRVEFTMA